MNAETTIGLAVHNLTKKYGGKTVLDRVSFIVEKGEFCILLGPSGCGKSTILRIIAGLEQPDGGEIRIEGRDVAQLTPAERDVTMVFQSYALYPHMNVLENLAFPLKINKTPQREIARKVQEVAGLLGIEELLQRKPRELSGGQRQRVAIGRAIVRNPRLFLFDEPLSNLDAQLRAGMRVELAKLHRRLQTTMLYVTHDQVEAMTLGSRIIILEKGVVRQIGTPGEVYDFPADLFVAGFIGSPAMNFIDGSLAARQGNIFFQTGGLTIPVGADRELERYLGKPVTAGIRPEFFHPGEGVFTGQLEHRERIGPEIILYVKRGDLKITAKTSTDFSGRIGEEISLRVDGRDILFFYEGRLIKKDNLSPKAKK